MLAIGTSYFVYARAEMSLPRIKGAVSMVHIE